MKKTNKLGHSFSKAGERRPLDHFDAFLGNMAYALHEATEFLQKTPLPAEDRQPVRVLAENIIASRHMFSTDSFKAEVAEIKAGVGFRKLMTTCSERDVHISLTHEGTYFHAAFDPGRSFATSQIMLKPCEPAPSFVSEPAPPRR